MSALYNIDTTYDALDNTVYDIFDLDAYCSSLSPSIPNSEPVPHPSAPTPHLKRFPKMCSHPAHPLPSYYPPLSPLPQLSPLPRLLSPLACPLSPTREKVISVQPRPHPPPVLWTPPLPPSPQIQSTSPQNSTSALCGCLNVSTSGSHRDGNQGSTSRVYRVWLKSSTPQKP